SPGGTDNRTGRDNHNTGTHADTGMRTADNKGDNNLYNRANNRADNKADNTRDNRAGRTRTRRRDLPPRFLTLRRGGGSTRSTRTTVCASWDQRRYGAKHSRDDPAPSDGARVRRVYRQSSAPLLRRPNEGAASVRHGRSAWSIRPARLWR